MKVRWDFVNFFSPKNENIFFLPDYQSNYVHWKKKKFFQIIQSNKQKSTVPFLEDYNYLYSGETGQTWPQLGDQGQIQQWQVKWTVCALDVMWWKWPWSSVIFLSKTHSPSLIMRKTGDTSPIKGRSSNYLISIPQNCQGHQKQGQSEKLSQPRGAWGDRMTK